MIIEIAYIFTMMICITAGIKLLAAIFGNGITLAAVIPFTSVAPSRHFLMYPSIMFQIWFWAERLGVFVQ